MSQTERRFRSLALRITKLLGVLAALSLMSPLGLSVAGAQGNGYCEVNCDDGSWCWVQGAAPCSCTCPAGGGAQCKCGNIRIIIDPAADAETRDN